MSAIVQSAEDYLTLLVQKDYGSLSHDDCHIVNCCGLIDTSDNVDDFMTDDRRKLLGA